MIGSWLWILGCVGLTLIITTGKVFAPLRKFLVSFKRNLNPFKILGNLLSCSMCTGFWIGFLWSWLLTTTPVLESILWGGLISLASYTADFFLILLEKLIGERHK